MVTKQLRRVRTLGRGASGAVVWLASDDASGELLAVKSARAAAAAAQLRREGRVLEGLSSPHIVPCLGARAAAGGEYQLLLEFAPGGSLADEAARRSGGRLPEREVRAYAADVARGLAYLHGRSLVHGDVKPANVVVGGDGRARLTDFGCARPLDLASASASARRPLGGTPAFMAPEVARGEEQGPAADVWALGCTVVEMASGRAPWAGAADDDNLLAALHRIGYTDAVPEVPAWLSDDARDFLAACFARRAADRPTAAQLLAHPFLTAAAPAAAVQLAAKPDFLPSPRSTLHGAFWDSCTDTDTEDEADEMSASAAERIGALARGGSALPDWDADEGWMDLQEQDGGDDDRAGAVNAAPALTATAADAIDLFVWAKPSPDAELPQLFAAADVSAGDLPPRPRVAGLADLTASRQGSYLPMHLGTVEEGNKFPSPLDRDGAGKVGSHRACNRNRNRVKMKRISLAQKIFPVCDVPVRHESYASRGYAARCDHGGVLIGEAPNQGRRGRRLLPVPAAPTQPISRSQLVRQRRAVPLLAK